MILFHERLERISLPSGTIAIIPFSKSWLSFKKKNEINSTENNPTLKLPKPLITPLKKLGISEKSSLDKVLITEHIGTDNKMIDLIIERASEVENAN